jgi:integrase
MPNARGRRRRFGSVRQLRSGQWQARYQGPDGILRPADRTFPTKTQAEQWLTRTEADMLAGDWTDPDAALITFREYATDWIDERPGLRPKTIEVYKYVLGRHLLPGLGARSLSEIKEGQVRRWRRNLMDGGASPVTAAKAYRLLKAIMNTAVDDGLIRRNPCRIKGAAQDRSPERDVLTVRQVFTLASVIDPRYRAMVLLGVFTSLRWGELAALRRADIDLAARTVRVQRTLTHLSGGGHVFGPPKTAAGRRTVVYPGLVSADLADHLERFTAASDDSLIFTSPYGTPLRHSNFRRRIWMRAIDDAGLPATHFHDLRHTGNNLTAEAGATLRELMDRMGQSSTRAALIYLHGSVKRQRAVADTMGELAGKRLADATEATPSGTDMAQDDEDES